MKTPAIVGIVIVAVVIIGGGIWYVTSHPTTAAPTQQNQQQTATAPTTGSGSLTDLWGMASSVQCDVSSTDTSHPFSGKVYVSNGKMHVDTTATMSGKTINTHMVRADGFIYTWSDLMPQGFKMAEPTVTQQASSSAPSAPTQGVSSNTHVSYTCAPWVPDATLLAPPTDVTFMTAPTIPTH